MRKTVLSPEHDRIDFDHYGEMVDFCSRMDNRVAGDISRQPNNYSYAMTNRYEEAVKLATEGWKEGGGKASKLTAELFKVIAQRIPRPEYGHDVTSELGLIDMGRYVEGDPECFVIVREDEDEVVEGSGNKVVRIVVNCAVSCAVDINTIVARGAAISALIDCLEFAGHRVELTSICVIKQAWGGSRRLSVVVPVKKADEILDPEKVAFVTGHPAHLRRFVLAVIERSGPEASRFTNAGYGMPTDPMNDAEAPKGDLYFRSGNSGEVDWTDPKKAEQWVIDEMRRQGVTVELNA